MSTQAAQVSAGNLSMSGLLRSEWTKLRTVRSTMWTLGMVVFIGLATSALVMADVRAHWAEMSVAQKATFYPIEVSLVGTYLGGALLLGILGILVVSSEYSTGTIRATLAAAPRRPMVLAAKVLVFGAVALVVAEIVAFAGFFLGQALLTSTAAHATLSSPDALRAVAGTGLYLCVVGLFALGIAVLIRHTAGAIGAYVGVMLVLPVVVSAFPNSLQHQVQRFLPLDIGSVMINIKNPYPDGFSPWVGLLILCGYTGLILAVGMVLLVRRDA